jgi:hypothetical protein
MGSGAICAVVRRKQPLRTMKPKKELQYEDNSIPWPADDNDLESETISGFEMESDTVRSKKIITSMHTHKSRTSKSAARGHGIDGGRSTPANPALLSTPTNLDPELRQSLRPI